MKIEERKVTVREVTEGYFNDAEEGVVGYDDQLDIRPKYQREFVYKDKQRDEVIRTVMKGLPLNVMYWVDRGEQYEDDPDEPRYEVLDGQQRTISLCEYVDGSFSVDDRYFYNLPGDQQKQILDYELFVYVCEGTPCTTATGCSAMTWTGPRRSTSRTRTRRRSCSGRSGSTHRASR